MVLSVASCGSLQSGSRGYCDIAEPISVSDDDIDVINGQATITPTLYGYLSLPPKIKIYANKFAYTSDQLHMTSCDYSDIHIANNFFYYTYSSNNIYINDCTNNIL